MSDQPRWELWRLDDNGNEFFVASYADEVEAEAERKRYEAKGHKQDYWVKVREAE